MHDVAPHLYRPYLTDNAGAPTHASGAPLLPPVREVLGDDRMTVIVTGGDDITRLGLHLCPDIDAVLRTLVGAFPGLSAWGNPDGTGRLRHGHPRCLNWWVRALPTAQIGAAISPRGARLPPPVLGKVDGQV